MELPAVESRFIPESVPNDATKFIPCGESSSHSTPEPAPIDASKFMPCSKYRNSFNASGRYWIRTQLN
jgi:hypothetical protein